MRHPLFVLFVAIFIVLSALLTPATGASQAILYGFDIAATVFVIATMAKFGTASAEQLRATAARK